MVHPTSTHESDGDTILPITIMIKVVAVEKLPAVTIVSLNTSMCLHENITKYTLRDFSPQIVIVLFPRAETDVSTCLLKPWWSCPAAWPLISLMLAPISPQILGRLSRTSTTGVELDIALDQAARSVATNE